MARIWITPELGWNDKDAPVGSDFVRLESNDLCNHELISEESTTRGNTDTALQNSINSINNTTGNGSGQRPLSNGVVNTNFNADMVDGYHVGHNPDQIPVSDGNINANLSASYAENARIAVFADESETSRRTDRVNMWIYPHIFPGGYAMVSYGSGAFTISELPSGQVPVGYVYIALVDMFS
jgi:hypothetical protein